MYKDILTKLTNHIELSDADIFELISALTATKSAMFKLAVFSRPFNEIANASGNLRHRTRHA